MPGRPTCKPQAKAKSQVKAKAKSKQRRKNIKPTGKPLPTLPPFDFKSYLREKDNRNFNLLIDQPEKCFLGGADEEGREGGSRGADAAAPYMLIAVKSVAADFDKRQVTECALQKNSVWCLKRLSLNAIVMSLSF